MRVLGLISGTSHDSIDACLADFHLDQDTLRVSVIATTARPYSAKLRARILEALPPKATTLAEVCELDTLIGQEFGALAADLVAQHGPVDLVSSHGQTVYHWVVDSTALGTLQLGQAAWIASAANAPTISDLRIGDIVVGGQGAPVVPILDLLALRGLGGLVVSLNLGGIANITVIKNGEIEAAFDTGPASALIDAVVNKYNLNPAGFDEDGRIAAGATIAPDLLANLLAEPYYAMPAPKSTGKELFHISYLEDAISRLGGEVSPEDQVATVTELTAITVADQLIQYGAEHLVVGGGGVRNRTLMQSIATKTNLEPVSFGNFGISADAKEALAMALIGWLSLNNLPATFSVTTGAKNPPVLGKLTPGPDGYPLRMNQIKAPRDMVISSA